MDVITHMSDEDLTKYIPTKGDRVAAVTFAQSKDSAESDSMKLALISSLQKRMKWQGNQDGDNDTTNSKKKGKTTMKLFESTASSSSQQTSVTASEKQAKKASKEDLASLIGISLYDPSHCKGKNYQYRQIRSPNDGGNRFPRVNKFFKKAELLHQVIPLFFPNGKNCHGNVEEFTFDISTDVHGTQLVQDDEIMDDMVKRMGLKHVRCYLLARTVAPADNEQNTQDAVQTVRKRKKVSRATSTVVSEQPITDIAIQSENATQFVGEFIPNEPDMTADVPDLSGALQDLVAELSDIPTSFDLVTENQTMDWPTEQITAEQDTGIESILIQEDLLARALNDSDIQFGAQPQNVVQMDDTLPMTPIVREVTVHRGRVCHDLITFFAEEDNVNSSQTLEIKMLKENGTPEVAEDNGGVLRDALTEFWENFYLQFTEGNEYKVPVLRHDMTALKWRAVAAIIRTGFKQEHVIPIKLAPCFMKCALSGTCDDSDILQSFLRFVPGMDKVVIQAALDDFASVDEDELYEVLGQHEAKKLVTADNIKDIILQVAHKELVQSPRFVSDCFNQVLHSTDLAQEDMTALYSKLQPNPRKVLRYLKFPEEMSQGEITLSSYVKKFVREMDDPEYLGLFLRFCTGSDLVTKDIQIRFTASELSDNVRCPTTHTCGRVLEIPRSYARDPYISFKSDFLSILKTRYWQMDIV